MKLYRFFLLAISILLACLTTSCDENNFHSKVAPASGTIKYNIHYSKSIMRNNALSTFFPNKMTVIYNQNAVKFNMKTALNMLEMELLNIGNDNKILFNLQGNKIYCDINIDSCTNDSLNNINILNISSRTQTSYPDSTVTIKGWESKSLSILYKDTVDTKIDVFYVPFATEEKRKINLLIMDEMPGMVTAINVQHGADVVTLIADEIDTIPVSNDKFKIDADYKNVTFAQLGNFVKMLDFK